MSRSLVVGTAGHIDHGKSALVKALTGTDPDRLKEERERGITIDLGFAHSSRGDVDVAFVDVPGHERFVRNMLAGAGGIDAVLLVVDAGEGIRPQTREHFEICRLLGLTSGVIALTKIDAVPPDRVAETRAAVSELTAGSFLALAPIIEVSAVSGAGLPDLRRELEQLAGAVPRQERPGIVRLPIDRSFSIKGFGAVVTGTLVSGAITEGDSLVVLPEGRLVRVRGIQVHGGRRTSVSAPQRVAVNLAGIETRELIRGQTIASEGTLAVTSRADARVDLLPGARPLGHGARVRVHQGASEFTGRISIAATRRAPNAAWSAVAPGDAGAEVPPGGSAFVRFRFEKPAAITRGDRMVIRAASPLVTVGGAIVLDPEPSRAGVRRTGALARFERLDQQKPPVELVVDERAGQGMSAGDCVRRLGLDVAESHAVVARLIESGFAISAGDRVIARAAVEHCERRVLEALSAFHRAHPQESGLPPRALRDRVGPNTAEVLFQAALHRLIARGDLRGTDRIALSGHTAPVSSELQQLQARVEAAIRDGALTPPDPATIGQSLKVSVGQVEQALQNLVKEKIVTRTGGLLFHRDALAALKLAVQSERKEQPAGQRVTLDVAGFKSRFNLTRKHAIPLLEWLDRERVTRRTGDVRIVL